MSHFCPTARAAAMGALFLAAACSQTESPKSTQAAARVNTQEISVHQIRGALARSGVPAADSAGPVASQALESVIDQELLVQKAVSEKLDRSPGVMQAIEQSRRQILAQAWLEKSLAPASRGSPDEISAFYKANPALFEHRRVYKMRQVVVADPADKLDTLKAQVLRARSIDEVESWLKGQGLTYAADHSTQPAESLPLAVLPHLYAMKDGQIALVPAPRGVAIVQLVQSQEAPLDPAQATPVIEQFLATVKRTELARAEVKKLRDKARIEYLGDFAAAQPGAAPGQPAEPLKNVKGAST